jgi:D-alanyl-D-alanine dipeptidase
MRGGRSGQDSDRERAGRYWVEQMEMGMAFIRRAYEHPVAEECEPLVEIRAAARERGVELLYSETRHPSGQPRDFRARPDVVAKLLAVATDLRASDHTLLIEDAFRTYEVQRDLALSDEVIAKVTAVILAAEPEAPLDLIIDRLSVVVQTRPRGAGHMAGAALDVSVLDSSGSPLDRGGPYITVSELMPMDSPFASAAAASNRRFVSAAMERHGFKAYPFEFWHYSADDVFARLIAGDPRPARYGPVRVDADGSVSPIVGQLEPMQSRADLEGLLTAFLARQQHPGAG